MDGSTDEAKRPEPKKPRSWALKAAGVLALLGLAAIVYVVFAWVSKPNLALYASLAQGQMAGLIVSPDAVKQPVRTFADAAGRPAKLQDWRGKVLLVNLWATWCAPCRGEMPGLAALQKRYGDQGLKVAAISVDRAADKPDATAMLAELSGGALDFYNDPNYALAFDLEAQGFPTTVLYDRKGREVGRMPAPADWSSAEAHALIEAALKN